MLPLNTNIRLAYANGKDDEQNFIQNLSLFLCTFLKEHGQLVEKRPNLRETLMEVGGQHRSLPANWVLLQKRHFHCSNGLLFNMRKVNLIVVVWLSKQTNNSQLVVFSHFRRCFRVVGKKTPPHVQWLCFLPLSCFPLYVVSWLHLCNDIHLGPITVGRTTFPVTVCPLV